MNCEYDFPIISLNLSIKQISDHVNAMKISTLLENIHSLFILIELVTNSPRKSEHVLDTVNQN